MHKNIFLFALNIFFKKFFQQSLWTAHFFAHMVQVTPTFQTTSYAFPGLPMGLVQCFLVVECLNNQLGKLASKFVDGCYIYQFSTRKGTHL